MTPQLPNDSKRSPLHALVLEDEMLIMLDIEEILKSIGIEQVSCFMTADQATKSLETVKPHIAFIDYQLDKTTTKDFALTLQTLQVPFAFVTASMAPKEILSQFPSALVIMKPFTETEISNTAEFLLARDKIG